MGELLKEGTRVTHRLHGVATIKRAFAYDWDCGGFYNIETEDGQIYIAHPDYVTPLEERDSMEEAQWTDG